MKALQKAREGRGVSQRRFAELAGISFRSLQLIEWGRNDPRISTLQKLAQAAGYPPGAIERRIESLFRLPVDSVAVISERIAEEGEKSWKLWLFNFVDAFRGIQDRRLLLPPVVETPVRIKTLLASTVEALCAEMEMKVPEWLDAVPGLPEPWFVSEMENLKAIALIESPVWFRKRNIFVLGNFLDRT